MKFKGKTLLNKLEKYWYCASEKPTSFLWLQGQEAAPVVEGEGIGVIRRERAPFPRAAQSPTLIPAVQLWHTWPEPRGTSTDHQDSMIQLGVGEASQAGRRVPCPQGVREHGWLSLEVQEGPGQGRLMSGADTRFPGQAHKLRFPEGPKISGNEQ